MGEIILKGYLCERCEHKWPPRDYNNDKKPLVCPKCKSPYWDVPRKNLVKKSSKLGCNLIRSKINRKGKLGDG